MTVITESQSNVIVGKTSSSRSSREKLQPAEPLPIAKTEYLDFCRPEKSIGCMNIWIPKEDLPNLNE